MFARGGIAASVEVFEWAEGGEKQECMAFRTFLPLQLGREAKQVS